MSLADRDWYRDALKEKEEHKTWADVAWSEIEKPHRVKSKKSYAKRSYNIKVCKYCGKKIRVIDNKGFAVSRSFTCPFCNRNNLEYTWVAIPIFILILIDLVIRFI